MFWCFVKFFVERYYGGLTGIPAAALGNLKESLDKLIELLPEKTEIKEDKTLIFD